MTAKIKKINSENAGTWPGSLDIYRRAIMPMLPALLLAASYVFGFASIALTVVCSVWFFFVIIAWVAWTAFQVGKKISKMEENK